MENIPQIKFGDDTNTSNRYHVKVYESDDAKEEPVLIPKINMQKGSKKSTKKFKFAFKKHPKIILMVLAVLVIFASIVSILSFVVYKKAMAFKASAVSLKESAKSQDLGKIKESLTKTKLSLKELDGSYKLLIPVRIIPFIGSYYSDGQHALIAAKEGLDAGDILIDAIAPYADIIGFSGNENTAGDGFQTAQERIDFVIKSIPLVLPKLDTLSQKVNLIKIEVDNIDPERYPKAYRGIAVRENLVNGISLIDSASELLTDGRPLLENSSYLLGVDSPRSYLVLFQNDKELRPTGGFLTAYSIAKVDKGRFTPVLSDDIYNLDSKYTPTVAAPEPFYKYLKGPYVISRKYKLRDMNWSPDFSESMSLFVKEAEKAGIKKIDGVIAVDTQFLVNLLDVLGTIGVPGYGDFSTKIVSQCNCPQVIYELESFADIEGPIVWSENEPGKIVFAPPNYDNRKKIIGPLMNSILANDMGQPKDNLPKLFEAGFKSLLEKHVLFYLFDERSQAAVEAFGIAGRIKDYEGDYLHINDANLGGRKSNLYVTQEVEQEIAVARDGSVEKTLTITYKNPEKHDGWLNSLLPNWVRVYVPKGSELLAAEGFEEKANPYEEFGKTVFAGFFQLRPEGVSKITLKYKLPFKVKGDYKLFIQKQPGTDSPLYILRLGKKEEEFFLKRDDEIRLRI